MDVIETPDMLCVCSNIATRSGYISTFNLRMDLLRDHSGQIIYI